MSTSFFDYTSRQMRKKEMEKIGVPKSLLEEALGDRAFVKKGYVHKLNPLKRNSPLVFDTAAFDSWYRQRVEIAAKEKARYMRASN